MDSQVARRIREALGSVGVVDDGGVVVPRSADHVAVVAGMCAAASAPMAVTSHPAPGLMVPPGMVVVSLELLTAFDVDAGSMTARAQAGAGLDDVQAAARELGLEVPGVSGSASARRVGDVFEEGGVPRRALTGAEAVLATGEVIRAGGPTMKDVAGYDLASLLLGRGGRLAILVEATFRLVPRNATGAVSLAPSPGRVRATAVAIIRAFDPQGLLRPMPGWAGR